MNALVDEPLIDALCRASRAGVRIELLVRGICCLRPGIKGISQNITVSSVVDRFLEHSRVWCFENACQPQVFVASADWMPRSFFRRIELAFPVEDGVIADRLYNEILATTLADNVKRRVLQSDGACRPVRPARGEPERRSQASFMALALQDEPGGRKPKRRPTRHPEVKLAPRPAILDAPRPAVPRETGR